MDFKYYLGKVWGNFIFLFIAAVAVYVYAYFQGMLSNPPFFALFFVVMAVGISTIAPFTAPFGLQNAGRIRRLFPSKSSSTAITLGLMYGLGLLVFWMFVLGSLLKIIDPSIRLF